MTFNFWFVTFNFRLKKNMLNVLRQSVGIEPSLENNLEKNQTSKMFFLAPQSLNPSC